MFVRGGQYRFADWGDAFVSHPFLTMSVTLEGVLAWGLDDVLDSEDIIAFGDTYLAPWRGHADRSQLEAGLATARRLGWICHALNTLSAAAGYEPHDRGEMVDRAAMHLRMFLDPRA